MGDAYDLVVIGGGSGGVRAGRMAGSLGARVALIECDRLGGTCVNVGCVPKKLLAYGASYSDHFVDSAGYGWSDTERDFDWATLLAAKDAEILRLNGIYERMLERQGVEIIRGRGSLSGPNTVQVGDRTLVARQVLIATGGTPWKPDVPGAEHCWTSDELFAMPTLPDSIAIVGGGYIAVEFASILHGLGVEVHLLYRGELFLRGFDGDIRTQLADEMAHRGIHLHFGFDLASVRPSPEGLRTVSPTGEEVVTERVLLATGRRPNVKGLGLESAGVAQNPNGSIQVDDQFQTSVPGVYAVGDVIDRIQLTPVALAEGMVVAHNLFGKGRDPVRYTDVPTAVFCTPNIGTVGLTEEQARQTIPRGKVFRSAFRPMKHTLSGRRTRDVMKVLVDTDTDRVVGCHMLGADAGEVIQGLAVAMTAGATKADFDRTIGIHPTGAEEFVTMREPHDTWG